jgi:hypothetical protein
MLYFSEAQSNGLFCGLIEHIIEKGVVVLQYADDTIICLKHNIKGARNLKMLLYMYELMVGLKINFLKSEIMTINDEAIGQPDMRRFLTVRWVLSP